MALPQSPELATGNQGQGFPAHPETQDEVILAEPGSEPTAGGGGGGVGSRVGIDSYWGPQLRSPAHHPKWFSLLDA